MELKNLRNELVVNSIVAQATAMQKWIYFFTVKLPFWQMRENMAASSSSGNSKTLENLVATNSSILR